MKFYEMTPLSLNRTETGPSGWRDQQDGERDRQSGYYEESLHK